MTPAEFGAQSARDLTIRDVFACYALVALFAGSSSSDGETFPDDERAAERAYQLADSMAEASFKETS